MTASGGRAICRNPWIVDAFLNGTFHAARRSRETGLWENAVISGRSDIAVVRSLRDGRRPTVAVRIRQVHDDLGLTKQPTGDPSSPKMRFCQGGIGEYVTALATISDRLPPLASIQPPGGADPTFHISASAAPIIRRRPVLQMETVLNMGGEQNQ